MITYFHTKTFGLVLVGDQALMNKLSIGSDDCVNNCDKFRHRYLALALAHKPVAARPPHPQAAAERQIKPNLDQPTAAVIALPAERAAMVPGHAIFTYGRESPVLARWTSPALVKLTRSIQDKRLSNLAESTAIRHLAAQAPHALRF
jgi:hypothetical protein